MKPIKSIIYEKLPWLLLSLLIGVFYSLSLEVKKKPDSELSAGKKPINTSMLMSATQTGVLALWSISISQHLIGS